MDEQRRQQILALIHKSVDATLTNTTDIIYSVEQRIQEKYPFITQVDLEQGITNISEKYSGRIPLTDSETEDEENQVL